MVRVTNELALSQDQLTLYYAGDANLGNLPALIFHGSATAGNANLSSSRIQLHIFTAAGLESYQRLVISPNSPFYQSVNFLPREKQGDEICRGLAFGLLKYFKELKTEVRDALILHTPKGSPRKRPGSAPALFAEQHAADLAGAMVKVENIGDIIKDLQAAFLPQNIHHVDVDLVLPPGTIEPLQEFVEDETESEELVDPTLKQYGSYAPLVKLFGEVTFLPTAKLRRAPSKPSSLNKSNTFLKDQKMSLRREMGELVDTEERYVIKMHELVNQIAGDFRGKSKSNAFASLSPTEQELEKLFPPCLDKILRVNSEFLDAIQKVMDDTEEEAMTDLETASIVSLTGSRHGRPVKDPTGTLAFANVLLEWFPQFDGCYQEYLRFSQDFQQIITVFLKRNSSFSQRVQQTGEQRLRAAVIEPVQRLPRYSLFIDNIINYLPISHPATQPMLKARDTITSICSMDPPTADKMQIVNRLRKLVESWPSSLCPEGRLVTAVDFIELPAPYYMGNTITPGFSREGMFLVFPDAVIILKKTRDHNMSAKFVQSEVEKPSAAVMMAPVTAAAGGQRHVYDFVFAGWHVLGETRFTVSDDGRVIWLTSLHEMKDVGSGRERNQPATVRTFILKGAYDGKAFKLTEEIIKARVEGRFPDGEREGSQWSFRSTRVASDNISLHTAVFEEGIDTLIPGRKDPAPIRIVVDHQKGTKGAPIGHYGVEIVSNVTKYDPVKQHKIETSGIHNVIRVDDVAVEEILSALSKHVGILLAEQYGAINPALTASFVSFYIKILKSMHVELEGGQTRSFRPPSPVKLISSFLSGGFSSSMSSLNNSTSALTTSPKKLSNDIPQIQPPSMTRTNSNKSTQSIHDVDMRSSVRAGADDLPMNHLVRLEHTFTSYIGAILTRKGNVVGRVLRNRSSADELAINALYNTLIEFPNDQHAAAEVGVDVLFVAFEKFLRIAWKDQMGQVMSLDTLEALQERALRLYPGDFADYVKLTLGEMAPQNRRAFIAIVKLLADLLEGCGNDGDRGALTVTMAELLVIDGNPHDYINLLDRMVEDSDRLFEGIGPGAVALGGSGSSTYGSISGNRSNHSNTGSLTSNASSLRRRFADTLLRQNSKNDQDSRPFMWRTLSKSSRSAATGESFAPTSSSLSKASLNRSKSIESANRRPISRDRPTVLGAFDNRPSSSHEPTPRLSPIGASPPPDEKDDTAKTPKKKPRRSSLSDLKSLMAAATLGDSSPLAPMLPLNLVNKFNTSPRTPSPTKIPVAGGMMDRNRPAFFRTGSPNQKEKAPMGPPARNVGNLTERQHNIMSPLPDTVVVKDLWSSTKGHAKHASVSSIPTLRNSTRDQAALPSRPTSSPHKSPSKLRLQSPQKLRERANLEKQAFNDGDLALQNELSKIGEEMAKQSLRATPGSPGSSGDHTKTQAALKALEEKMEAFRKETKAQQDTMRETIDKLLQVSENRVNGLDQLYKEASAENEIMYEKMNGQLGKIVQALKGKGKEDKEELVKQLKESSEETAKAKKESARLKRELLSARARVKFYE